MSKTDFIEEFRQHLVADGKSPKTVASYTGDAQAFLAWLESKGTAFDGRLTRFQVTTYLKHLSGASLLANTVNKKVNSLRCFNLFLNEASATPDVVVHPGKDRVKVALGSERQVEVFSDEEVERILFHVQDRKRCSSRDALMVTLLLYTGVRVSELVSVRLQDVDLSALTLRVVGKGGKHREVPLRAEVAEAAREYLGTDRRESRYRDSQFLLLTQRAGRMDKNTVNRLLKKHGKILGITMKPHKFRHTFCTRLVRRGVPLSTVAMLAGHASVQTTARFYVNTSREDKQRAVELL